LDDDRDVPKLLDKSNNSTNLAAQKKRVAFVNVPAPSSQPQAENKQSSMFQRLATSMQSSQSVTEIGSSQLNKFTENDDDDNVVDVDAGEGLTKPLQIITAVPKKQPPIFDDENEDDSNGIFAHAIEIEEKKNQLIEELKKISTLMSEQQLTESFTKVYDIITDEKSVRSCIIAQQGLMPVIEVIEFGEKLSESNALLVLKVVYAMIEGHTQIKESYCLLGGIPPVLKFLDVEKYKKETRALAMKITMEICRDISNEKGGSSASDNIQMFISCGGINSLVETLQYDIEEESDLVFLSIQNIKNIFQSHCGIQISDICRLFMSAHLIPPLAETLYKIVETPRIRSEETIHTICFILDTLSQGDSKVKIALSDVSVMENIVASTYDVKKGALKTVLTNQDLFLICKAIYQVSAESETRDNLHRAGLLEMACAMVKMEFKENGIAIHSNLIQFLANMCKLSKDRIAIVAKSELISALKPYLVSETELKALVMYMLIDFQRVAFTNKDVMIQLLNDGLIEIYISALNQPYWGARAMTAIAKLVPEEDFNLIPVIQRSDCLEKFRNGIDSVNFENAPTMLQSLTEICKASKEFTQKLADQSFATIIISKLSVSLKLPPDSQIPFAVLDLILTIFNSTNKPPHFMTKEMEDNVTKFFEKGNVKQKATAKKILQFFQK
jgi:hypothetical protein